jgi:hypothetical protein
VVPVSAIAPLSITVNTFTPKASSGRDAMSILATSSQRNRRSLKGEASGNRGDAELKGMNMGTIDISKIIVENRHRKDMGDIDGLAKSIAEVGLLHPIVVNSSNILIAGERRFEAMKTLGWQEIPITVVTTLDDARKAMMAERDENSERKPFTPSEAAKVGQRMEVLVKREAKERQRDHGGTAPGKTKADNTSGTVPEVSERGETRDIVGQAVGMAGRTYQRAKTVINRGTPEIIEAMDKGEVSISTAAIIATNEPEIQAKLLADQKAGRAHVNRKAPPDAKGQMIPKTRKLAQGKKAPEAIRGAIGTLVGLATSLDQFSVKDAAPSDEEAIEWERDLTAVISALSRFRRELKEHCHVG